MTRAQLAVTLLVAVLCAAVGTGVIVMALTRRPARLSTGARTVILLTAALIDLSAAAVAVLALEHPPP